MLLIDRAVRPADLAHLAHLADLPPAPLAPVDTGFDAGPIARRVLAHCRDRPELSLSFRALSGCWVPGGELREATFRGDVCQLVAADVRLEIDLHAVFAVSFIGHAVATGVRLFDIDGTSLALWAPDAQRFHAWLASVDPHLEWAEAAVQR